MSTAVFSLLDKHEWRIFVSTLRLVCARHGSKSIRNPKPKPFSPKSSVNDANNSKTRWHKNNAAELSALAERLGHKLEDIPSLKTAIQDQESPKSVGSLISPPLHRLSVLGKSTMMHYVNEYLYFAYPTMNGLMLTDLGSSITNESALVQLSNYLGITDLINPGATNSPRNEDSIYQIFCAVVGSIFQDLGPKSAKIMVHDFIIPQLAGKDLEELIKLEHPRLMLNSILASQGRPKSISRLINESGRTTHFPSFVVGIYSGGDLLGEGTGSSLQRAENEAMITALHSHFRKQLSTTPLPSDLEDDGNSHTQH